MEQNRNSTKAFVMHPYMGIGSPSHTKAYQTQGHQLPWLAAVHLVGCTQAQAVVHRNLSELKPACTDLVPHTPQDTGLLGSDSPAPNTGGNHCLQGRRDTHIHYLRPFVAYSGGT